MLVSTFSNILELYFKDNGSKYEITYKVQLNVFNIKLKKIF